MSDRPTGLTSVLAWGLLLLVLIGAIAVAVLRSPPVVPAASARADAPPVLFDAPEFTLTGNGGRELASHDLAGRVWVADFIFTSCAGPCPLMTRKMADLQKRFANENRVQFVSFSVDPTRDTPEVLAAYARQFEADTRQWHFLTGDEKVIHKLALDGFKVLARRATTQEMQQPETQEIIHSPYFFLVDARGRVRGTYDGTDEDRIAALVGDIRRVLEERR